MRNPAPYDGNVIVVDIEGTIADAAHRMHLRGSDWDEFYEAARYDPPMVKTRNVLAYLSAYHHVLAYTTRPGGKTAINNWLVHNGFGSIIEDIISPDSDLVFGAEEDIKISLLEEYFGYKEEVLKSVFLVLEDRDKTVSALREYGLTVWQIRQGDY